MKAAFFPGAAFSLAHITTPNLAEMAGPNMVNGAFTIFEGLFNPLKLRSEVLRSD